MSQTDEIDSFVFIYELEPSGLCANFRFDSKPIWTASYPPRRASFSVWQNMLVIFYNAQKGTMGFDGARAEADYFATAIVACFGYFRRQVLEHSPRNWVEFTVEKPASKVVVGRFEAYGDPPMNHPDNKMLGEIADLMPTILSKPPLARSLHDFYSCLSKQNPDFYVFAYRAIEDIRVYFEGSDDDAGRKKAWDRMNAALGRKREDYDELVGFAEKFRHNNMLGDVTDQESAEKQIEFVCLVIEAFVKYLLSNKSSN